MNPSKTSGSQTSQAPASHYLRLNCGTIAWWDKFDEETQIFEFKPSPTTVSLIHRRDTRPPTEAELVDYLRFRH
jgi:hypothetical protein